MLWKFSICTGEREKYVEYSMGIVKIETVFQEIAWLMEPAHPILITINSISAFNSNDLLNLVQST